MQKQLLLLFIGIAFVFALHPPGSIKLPNGKSVYVSGVNLPWFQGAYGHDFGPNPWNPSLKVTYNGTAMGRMLRDIKRVGWNALRVFLCEGGEGITFDSNQFITGLDPTFLKNVDDLVARSQQTEVMLYLVISDSFVNLETRSFIFRSPIIDRQQQDAYLKNVLNPLAIRYKGNNNILAFEIQNEIESDIAGENGNFNTFGATWDQARNFISRSVDAIKRGDPLRLVSVSSGFHSFQNIQTGLFTGIGLSFYDYHSYSSNSSVYLAPVLNVRTDLPLIIGEFGSTAQDINDAVQNATVIQYYDQNANAGYAGGFVWNYGYPGDDLDVNNMFNPDGTQRPVVASIKQWISQLN